MQLNLKVNLYNLERFLMEYNFKKNTATQNLKKKIIIIFKSYGFLHGFKYSQRINVTKPFLPPKELFYSMIDKIWVIIFFLIMAQYMISF